MSDAWENPMAKYDLDDIAAERDALLAEQDPPPWQPPANPTVADFPEVDQHAPEQEQLDQLDQLITRGLQAIDGNVSHINSLLAGRLLPAIKRMAIASKPARDASRFLMEFYSTAANIRVPTDDDGDVEWEDLEENEEEYEAEATVEADTNAYAEADATAQLADASVHATPENSFMPSAAMSSTPARGLGAAPDVSDAGAGPSWRVDETPMMRLTREMDVLMRMDDPSFAPTEATPAPPAPAPDRSTSRMYSPGKGRKARLSSPKKRKSLVPGSPLLRTVLTQGLRPGSPARQRLSALSAQNPYLPPGSPAKGWSGLVDASRARHVPEPSPAPDERPAPPRVPKPSANPVLARTPGKAAAQRITKDMLRSIVDSHRKALPPQPTPRRAFPTPRQKGKQAGAPAFWQAGAGGNEDTSSSLGTMSPPDASRYTGVYGRVNAATPRRGGGDDDDDSPMPTPPSISRYARLVAAADAGQEVPWDDDDERSPSPTPNGLADPMDDDDEEFEDTFHPGGLGQRLQQAARGASPPESSLGDAPSATRYRPGYADESSVISGIPSMGRYAQYTGGHGPPASEASGSTLPPPSAGRYTQYAAPHGQAAGPVDVSASTDPHSEHSFGHLMRAAGLDVHGFTSTSGGAADASFESADDSFGETMPPSALGAHAGDDSFESNSSGSSFDGQPVFTSAGEADGFDDSFEDDDIPGGREDTVFGLPPRQASGGLHMLGAGLETAQYAHVVDRMQDNSALQTPTPWTGRD